MAGPRGYIISFILGFTLIWIINFITKTVSALKSPVLGPKHAKVTAFWKFINVRNRRYISRLRELHKYGPIVQVSPTEFSIGSPDLLWKFEELEKFMPYTLLISPEVARVLPHALQMANIFHYEPLLDKCNHALLCALVGHAENEEEIGLPDLLARYAYDTMFCTTTGSAAGFLARKQDISCLLQALENWKFYAVLYGSYYRFRPITAQTLVRSHLQKAISKHLDLTAVDDGPCIANELKAAIDSSDNGPIGLQQASLEASIALMASGADPVITHLLSAIYFTYRDTELVEALRDEVENAKLSQPPKLKELLHAKPRMPLLHAVLQESLRLIHTTGETYVSPKGGVTIGSVDVPEKCSICCEPSVAHVNPNIFASAETFNPSRWIDDPAVAPNLRSHMITFGAGTDTCPGKELHLSIVAKVFTQLLLYFDFEMASVDTPASPVNLTFDDFKNLTITKVVLPKNIRPIITGLASPLRATAPAFAPDTTSAPELPPGFTPKKISFGEGPSGTSGSFKVVGNYAARIGDVVDFVPNTMTHGGSGHSISPTLSVAITAKSSDVSSTPMTWTDEETLEDIIGRQLTNKMMTDFDPTMERMPRQLLKTGPISEPRNRYLLHDIVERVWGGRLNHQTSRKENCMYIWVPGTKLPKWLFNIYQNRDRNDRKRGLDNRTDAASSLTIAGPPTPARAVNPVWGGFAQDENARYMKVAAMSGEEFVAAEREKAEATGEKQAEEAPRAPAFKETFKQTGTKVTDDTTDSKDGGVAISDTTNTEPKKASLPPHLRARAASPPQLRNNSVDSANDTNDAESASEKNAWCAAKLPFAYSSD